MGIGDRIKKLRTDKGLTQEELGKLVGVKRAAVNKWETGSVENLKRSTIEKLSEIFSVSPSYLIELKNSEPVVTRYEKLKLLPIVGKISCGNGALAYEEIEGYEPTPEAWLNGGEYFYLRAKGDSMVNSRIFDGDLVLIRRQEDLENGEIGVVLIGDEAYLKKVYKHDYILKLESTNPMYPMIECNAKEQRCKIVGKLKKIIVNI